MRHLGTGDYVFVFMGETLLHVKITHYDGKTDHLRLTAEDEANTYCFYTKDCYLSQQEAIRGMVEAIRGLRDCDCGETEVRMQYNA